MCSPSQGLGSLFYGFLILTWQKGSGGPARPRGEWPEDPRRKDSWTIKRDLCLWGRPSPSRGDKSLPEKKDKRCRVLSYEKKRAEGDFSPDSCRAGLVTSQGLLRSSLPQRPKGTGFLGTQPVH